MHDNQERALRAEIRAWLDENWSSKLGLVEWRTKLIDAGWAEPTWPRMWGGRDLPANLAAIAHDELRAKGAVGVCRFGPRGLAQATLLVHGSDQQKRKFLRPSLTGEEAWCQLFSEPGSGSDVAAASTRAEWQDDCWIINGQKLWSTSAHHADWGLLLARTNWEAPKHRGLTYFIIDMRQPGIEAHPLRQMNGYASFNQVFFTDAKIPHEYIVGEEGGGWAVATTTLMHERRAFDSAASAEANERTGRIYEEERAERAVALEPYKWYPQRTGRVDLVIERASAADLLDDAVVRQEIAKLLILSKCSEWTSKRARAARADGRAPGPEGSLGKLAASRVARCAARVHTLIGGANTMLAGEDATSDGLLSEIVLSTPAISIAGGTDEIQRNIVAERVLGMPKEFNSDASMPFRDVLKNSVKRG